jgi:hypothetical protein
VIARPRIKAVDGQLNFYHAEANNSLVSRPEELTVDIALPLICLYNEQIRYVPSNMILVACRVATKNFLESVI